MNVSPKYQRSFRTPPATGRCGSFAVLLRLRKTFYAVPVEVRYQRGTVLANRRAGPRTGWTLTIDEPPKYLQLSYNIGGRSAAAPWYLLGQVRS